MKPMHRVARRYLARMAIAMIVYLASLFAADYLIEDIGVSRPAAFALALIPGLASASVFWAVGMFIVETKDEFMRMFMVRVQLIATGFAMTVFCVWGFLEEYTLVPHMAGYMILVLWAFGQLVGLVTNRVTLGTWGECW